VWLEQWDSPCLRKKKNKGAGQGRRHNRQAIWGKKNISGACVKRTDERDLISYWEATSQKFVGGGGGEVERRPRVAVQLLVVWGSWSSGGQWGGQTLGGKAGGHLRKVGRRRFLRLKSPEGTGKYFGQPGWGGENGVWKGGLSGQFTAQTNVSGKKNIKKASKPPKF